MAYNVYIQGLSGAGFRVPNSSGSYARVKEKVTVQVDLDAIKTQLILAGERDNFIRVRSSSSTTATVAGLTRYGFRIPESSDGAYKVCKLGTTVTVDLTNAVVRRILRRSYGRYFVIDGNTSTLTAPTLSVPTPSGTGGTLAANTYYYKVTALNANGETIGSNEVTATTTGTTSSVPLSWTAVSGATTYRIYRGTATNAESVYYTSATNSYTDTNAASTNGTVPGTNTAYVVQSATSVSIRGVQAEQNGIDVQLAAAANATLKSDGSNPADGDTVTINNKTYRFKTTMAAANDVQIGASADATLDNLVKAVNLSGIAGTNYFTGTTSPTGVTAGTRIGSGINAYVIFTATATGTTGDTYPSTATGAHFSFESGTTFSGGGAIGTPTKVYRGQTVTLDATQPKNYTKIRRFYKEWIEA